MDLCIHVSQNKGMLHRNPLLVWEKLWNNLDFLKFRHKDSCQKRLVIFMSNLYWCWSCYMFMRVVHPIWYCLVLHDSYQKLDEALNTKYGHLALNLTDKALTVAENYVDYYLPPTPETEQQEEGKLSTHLCYVSSSTATQVFSSWRGDNIELANKFEFDIKWNYPVKWSTS